MEDGRNIDFKKHTSPPASKMHMLKIIFYVLFLGVLLYMVFSKTNEKRSKSEKHEVEIDGNGIVLE